MNSDYITKKEYMQNNNIIATSFERLITEFRSEMKSIHSRLDKVDKRLNKLEIEVAQIKDSLIDLTFEMRSMREELAAVTYRNIKLTDTTESHGTRLTSLEEKLTA